MCKELLFYTALSAHALSRLFVSRNLSGHVLEHFISVDLTSDSLKYT
jgi:hypothetical protein